MREEAPQREHSMRAVFNALRYMVRAGCPWRMIPNDMAPWYTVHQQAQRWIKAGCFEAMAHDLRKVLRLLADKHYQPSAVILDGRTLQSTPESGKRAGYDGYKRKKGSKVHAAVDTLGHLLALKVTAANEQERAQVADLAQAVQKATGDNVEVAFVHRRGARPGRRPTWNTPHRGQTCRGQERLRPLAQAMGRGTLLCLGSSLSPPRQGL